MYKAVIVDDEPLIVDGLVNAIEWTGFHIELGLATTDPQAALDYCLENPVNIVIADVSMPVMNGLQLIQKIKKAKPSVFCIILSAYQNFEYARTALRYGAENYLLKPLDPDELSDTISQIINHIKEREQLNITYGRSMMTFRNAFTEQWLKNLVSNAELSTKAELLGINLDAPGFTATVFSCSSGGEIMMSRFFDFLLQYLPGHYTGNFFFETPLRLVGVLSPISPDEADTETFLALVLKSAASNGIRVFASIGDTVRDYSQVYQSYHQADRMAFLEYSRMPFVFFRDLPGLEEAATGALEAYDRQCGHSAALERLFLQYVPELSCYSVLSKRIAALCKKEYELWDKNPELIESLSLLPLSENLFAGEAAVRTAYYEFTLKFLKRSDPLLARLQQSMYPMVDAVIKTIHEFSDKDISLKTLAFKLNVTPSYLGTVFHQQTGYYFNDYLTDARLKYAAHLLEHTDMKIKDIVDKIGFSSQTYFNRSFKRYFDTSPISYRRDKKIRKL
nr:response regulator [uncultured Acetatifactor sp.]